MKKKLFVSLLSGLMLVSMLTGCGSSNKASEALSPHEAMSDAEYVAFDESYSADYFENSEMDFEVKTDVAIDKMDSALKKVAPEMLVYRCEMSIDTTDFDKVVTSIKARVNEYDGFIESENLYDDANKSGKYIIEETERLRSYTIKIRVPSSKYQDFVSQTEGLGVLRSKVANVDDVSVRYGTLSTTLAIYEADYAMYLEEYENETDKSNRMALQQEIRDLAIEISSIKTQMSAIESDVAYSYVTIRVDEYNVIPEPVIVEPEPEPTFWTRLKNEWKDSWDNLCDFLEGALFFVIDTWWGFLFFAIIAFVIFGIVKLIISICKKASAKRRAKEAALIEAREAKEAKEKERRLGEIEKAKLAKAEEANAEANKK